MTCCNNNCREGRDCPNRALFDDDQPIGTPESDGLFAVCCTVFLVFVTVAAAAAVFLYAYRNFYPA